VLDVLLPLNGRFDGVMGFRVDEAFEVVFPGEPVRRPLAVLPDTPREVCGDPDVKGQVGLFVMM